MPRSQLLQEMMKELNQYKKEQSVINQTNSELLQRITKELGDYKKEHHIPNIESKNNTNKSIAESNTNILVIKTTQTSMLKKLFKIISELVGDEECSLVFTAKNSSNEKDDNNAGGLCITKLTENKSVLVKLELGADNFEYFKCGEQKLKIGINICSLYRALYFFGNDPIVIYLKKNNDQSLCITSFEKYENGLDDGIKINLADLSDWEIPIPKFKLKNKITTSSKKLHKVCKRIKKSSDFIEIFLNNNGKIIFLEQDENINSTNLNEIKGIYEINPLMIFSRCHEISKSIDLFMKNDYPLITMINIGNLGKLYVYISPIERVPASNSEKN